MKYLLISAFAFMFLFNDIDCQPKSIYIGLDNISILANQSKIGEQELKTVFFQYLFLIEINVLLKKHKNKLEDLPELATLSFELGEINALEKEKMDLDFLNLEKKINECTYEIAITENQIRKLLKSTADIIPKTDTLIIYYSDEAAQLISMQKELSSDSCVEKFLNNENQILLYEKAESSIQYYLDYLLPYADRIEKNASIMLQNEEIERFRYFELLTTSLQIKYDYLNVINEFNHIVLQLEKAYENQ